MTLQEYLGKHRYMSAAELARAIPCTEAHISKIKNGRGAPSYEMARRIEECTGGLVPITNWYSNETTILGDITVSI